MSEMLEKLKAHLESPEGRAQSKAYFENLAKKEMIKNKRFDRFDEWLETNDFDKLLYRLILQHDDDYREKCYDKGYEPHMNNVLKFVFDYACDRGKQLEKIPKDLECNFPQAVYEFRGYYFEIVWGQGSITAIYNKDDLRRVFWKW
jgi:hypothetical protein